MNFYGARNGLPDARRENANLRPRTPPCPTGLVGWGARIRTWEWRNQNPLPYHLATPQFRNRPLGGRTIAAPQWPINAELDPKQGLRGRHDPDAIAVLHRHAVGLRQPADSLDDRGGEFSRRQHRAAALSARASEALVDWVDADFGEPPGTIVTGGREVLPELGVRHVALLAVARAGIKEIRRRRVVPELKTLVSDGGKERQRLILHDQVADRIEDRLAVVELDSERRMRAVPNEDVGARVDRRARKGAGEVGRFGQLALG